MDLTKAELIERYGEQWYEDFKTRQREAIRQRYYNDIEASRGRCRVNYHKHRASHKKYADDRRIIYNINARDRIKLDALGLIPDGMEVHHLKYHLNKNDDWMKDIVIMTRAEHRKWHREHPEFNALEHVV